MSKEEQYKAALELVLDYYKNEKSDDVALKRVLDVVKYTLYPVDMLLPWKQQSLRLDYGDAKAGSVVVQAFNGRFVCVMGEGVPNPDKFHENVTRAKFICRATNAFFDLEAIANIVADWEGEDLEDEFLELSLAARRVLKRMENED